jgi:hypothetical protein
LKISGSYTHILPCDNGPLTRRATTIKVASSRTLLRGLSLSAVARVSLVALFTLAAVPSGFAQAAQASPQAEASTSKHVQLEGELEILTKDFKDHAEVSYSLKTANGEHVPMRFVNNDPPTHFLTGDHVQAEGDLSNSTLLLYSGSNVKSGSNKGSSGSTTTSTPSGPVPYTLGPQATLVMLVTFQDDPIQPFTASDVQTLFSGQINNFFVENSYGQTSIVPTVVGWYTIPDSVTTCNTSQIATDAQNAASAAGVVLSNYTRYVYLYPNDTACGFAGSSTVGGNPSHSWINGTLVPHVINHELGHGFGLWHAHALDCGLSATICSNGTVIEYGDPIDTMGDPLSTSADYNAYQKERLGWLNYGNSPAIQTVQSSGSYTITPYELAGSGPTALKILKSTDPTTGANTWYYLEARQAIGFDSYLSDDIYSAQHQNETTGVLVHIGTDNNANSSDLLDMTPATPISGAWWDMSLAAGQTYTDSSAGFTVSVSSVSGTGAIVQITTNGSSAPSGPLTTTVTTNGFSYLPGQTVEMTVTVLSGTSPAAGVSVTGTIKNPNGSSTTLKGTTGSAGTALLSYNLSKRASTGTYQVAAAPASTTAVADTSFIVQ